MLYDLRDPAEILLPAALTAIIQFVLYINTAGIVYRGLHAR